ncbi:MAG: helix-turn-helix domain-containing protein [Ktedonobacterales bacterium]|nr:helix-turn-helix domain-containing protein [Ktedonobacterales bacterium]
MVAQQKDLLRACTSEERKAFEKCVRASSERVDRRQRAQALLAVAAGASFSAAARQAGYRSGDSVTGLVLRFNQQGIAALDIGTGRGRKPRYGPEERTMIVQSANAPADREADGTATWSLTLLQRHLRQHPALAQVSADTIERVLREAGASYEHTRTWCTTETSERLHQQGQVIVRDPDTEAKKN